MQIMKFIVRSSYKKSNFKKENQKLAFKAQYIFEVNSYSPLPAK